MGRKVRPLQLHTFQDSHISMSACVNVCQGEIISGLFVVDSSFA
jgi:hypothetical protein